VEWWDIAEASALLGVTDRQVRNLASHGDIPARRLGGAWLLDADGVRAYARSPRSAGRPVSALMAWALLCLAERGPVSGAAPPRCVIADRQLRYRAHQLLAEGADVRRWERWLSRRARPRRIWLHPGLVERLAADRRLRPGGAYAAGRHDAVISAGAPNRFYVDEDAFDAVLHDHRAELDPAGPIEFYQIPRAVPDELRPVLGEPVPLAVAMADLLDSGDARDRHAASEYFRRVTDPVLP
jgi:excisionase family DNA binding protein